MRSAIINEMNNDQVLFKELRKKVSTNTIMQQEEPWQGETEMHQQDVCFQLKKKM